MGKSFFYIIYDFTNSMVYLNPLIAYH